MLKFFRNQRLLTFGLPYALLGTHLVVVLNEKGLSPPAHGETKTLFPDGFMLLAMFLFPVLALGVGVSDLLVKVPGPGGALKRRVRVGTVLGIFTTLVFIPLLLFCLYVLAWAVADIH